MVIANDTNCKKLELTHHFSVLKHRSFRGWAGTITEWDDGASPKVNFGKWKLTPDGGTVKFECVPFQLCMYGANSKEMRSQDKFTYFAIAGLGVDGTLVLRRLTKETDADAREIFQAGGWKQPDIGELVSKINLVSNSDISGRRTDELESIFSTLMTECTYGYGMISINEQQFFNILSTWPLLAPLHVAFAALREKIFQLRSDNRTASLNARKVRLDEVLSIMNLEREEITSVNAASRILGIPITSDAPIPHNIKEVARKLRKDFGDYFPAEKK